MSIYVIFESQVLKESFWIRFLPSVLNCRTKHYRNERENERFCFAAGQKTKYNCLLNRWSTTVKWLRLKMVKWLRSKTTADVVT